MLTISDISKSFGPKTLFENVSLQVNRGDRIGLVGPNGAGKSTLFALILGEDEPDSGTINFERNITMGFLPQESAPVSDETVLELAMATTPEMAALQKKLKAWDEAHPDDILHDHDDNIHARFDELGGYQLEPKAKRILKGLSFRDSDFNRPAKELSGGWVMRAHLARLLVQEPDLLILDEPTNHLDLESLQWFQEYLKNYPGGILMISHDREFLNQLVTNIWEIRQSQMFRYRGNFEEFLVQKEAAEIQQLAAFKNQQREIDRLMDFVNRFRAKASKATQAQSKLKQVGRMEKIEAPDNDEKTIKFRFPQPQRSGLRVVRLQDVHFAYGENVIYRGIDFESERGQRIVLVGPNGAGKSTLLKMLAGVLKPQAGTCELGHNVKAGYFSQYRVDVLDTSRTVFEEALDTPQRVTEEFVRTILGAFLFRDDDVFKKISVLSGGEKSRLAIVKLLLDPPNLLLMDEPTTHLDMASIEALIGALEQFEGTVIFISHDVYFIREIANKVVHVNAGCLTHYAGDYQYYLDKTKASSARGALVAGGDKAPAKAKAPVLDAVSRKEQKRLEAEARNARSKDRKAFFEPVKALEKRIAAMEAEQAQLVEEIEKPETYYDKPGRAAEINRRLSELSDEIPKLMGEWEAASGTLEAYDNSHSPA
ncbi:MAG: ABC-F family ATP-binding cassette domain-containing protein [Verrucomicrobia bacterium]|nr:ABC-F family ATP-binding cassette domain-containing protein [Verrucomicrobiota bacterium]